MPWYKKITIPFKLYDSATGTMADWSVVFRNEISGGSADVSLQSAAKLKKLGELNMEFSIIDNEFIMPNFDMTLVDPYRDANNTSLFDFISNPLNYGIKSRVQVYVYKGAVLTYKFFTDRTKLNFNDKTYELKVRSIVEHNSPSAIIFRDQNGVAKNPLGITETGGALIRFYSLLIYIANGMGLSLESSRPRGYTQVNYKFGNWYRWDSSLSGNKPTDDSDLNLFDATMYVSAVLSQSVMKGQIQSGYKSLKDVLRLLGDGIQIMLGSDEFGYMCIRPRIRFTGFVSIPDSEVMQIEFEEWQEYLGAFIKGSAYPDPDTFQSEAAGNVVLDDEGNVTNSEQVYTIIRDYPEDLWSMCSRVSFADSNRYYPLCTERYVASSGSDQICEFVDHKIPKAAGDEIYNGSMKFAAAVLYNLIKMTKGRVAVKVRGTSRKIYEDYAVTFYYANGNSITLNIATDKITKNLEENYTIIRGFVVGDSPFVEKYPSNQPTGINFTNLTATSLTVNWLRAASAVTGYVAFSQEGTAPTFVPVDGNTYSVGTTYSGAKCVASGDVITANLSSLTANTDVYVSVWSYNDVGGVRYYCQAQPLTGSQKTLQTAPAAQPSTFVVQAQGETTLTLRATPSGTAPTADGFIILGKIGAYSGEVPVQGHVYSVGDIINDAIVLFVGAGTGTSPRDFAITGLTAGQAYYCEIFASRGSGAAINYLTTSPLQGIAYTLASFQATAVIGLSFTNITSSQLKVNASTNGYADGVTIIYDTSAPSFVPVDGNEYTNGSTVSGSQKAINIDFSSGFTYDLAALTNNTAYHFKAYPYKGSGSSRNYQTSPTPSDVTCVTAASSTPTNQVLSFNASGTPANKITLNANQNNPASDSMVIYRKGGSYPTNTPVDGIDPTVDNSSTTNQVCVYDGPITSGIQVAASTGTTYNFRCYTSNGTGSSRKYNLTSPKEAIATEGDGGA